MLNNVFNTLSIKHFQLLKKQNMYALKYNLRKDLY